MGRKKDVSTVINEFLERWDRQVMCQFFDDVIPIVDLFNVDEDCDWVIEAVQGDKVEARTLRLIRAVYLLSRFFDLHSSKMTAMSFEFKGLWKRMEKESEI